MKTIDNTVCIEHVHVYIVLALIQDYVSQENKWSLNGRICQRSNMQLLMYSVFSGYIRKSIYNRMDFQISEGLHLGPEFSHNYTIDYLVDFIINHKK